MVNSLRERADFIAGMRTIKNAYGKYPTPSEMEYIKTELECARKNGEDVNATRDALILYNELQMTKESLKKDIEKKESRPVKSSTDIEIEIRALELLEYILKRDTPDDFNGDILNTIPFGMSNNHIEIDLN